MSGIVTKPYNEELAVELCDRIAQGTPLKEILADARFPSDPTLRKWMADEPTFNAAYARAREAQMHRWSEDIVEIADDAAAANAERIDKDGNAEAVVDPGAVQAARLRIDTRKFLMAKLAAKTYGDKVEVAVSGSIEVSGLSDEELEARTRARLVTLGVEVAAPMLVALPGAGPAPAPAVTSEPEPAVVDHAEPIDPADPAPALAGKKSANDLLGIVV